MATVATKSRMTAEEFWDWLQRPEQTGKRYELEQGTVIEMPPPAEHHGFVCWLVSLALGRYVLQRGAGYACTSDTGLIVQQSPDTVRGPDLILFLESRTLDEMQRKFCSRIPSLAVEVLSPSDSQTKTLRRVRQYHQRGVALVWVIDPEERTVHVYRPDEFPKVLDETDTLAGNGVLPDFACQVADLFTLPGPTPAAP